MTKTSDSRWHEAGHGTAFKTRWIDQGLYQLASFMIMRDPTTWPWSHTRHHTDTLILGRDPEIAVMRPARLAKLLVNFVGPVDVPVAFGPLFAHTFHDAKIIVVDSCSRVDYRYWNTCDRPRNTNRPRKWGAWD